MNQNQRTITYLTIAIAVLATIAALTGIVTTASTGSQEYQSIRGETITLYGRGIYKHMSAEVAIQGIAQDYVTLFLAVPMLLLSLYKTWSNSLKWRLMLAGTLAYFLVTYTFYLNMAMYNELFLCYAALMGLSFFALAITALGINRSLLADQFSPQTPTTMAGSFLIFTAIAIGVLWLGVVLPPLMDGTVYPQSVEHYTTLVVQGNDLGLGLPLAFVSGYLLIKKKSWGYLLGPVYLIFLSFLMTALVAKIIYLGIMGYNIIPAVFIIPFINLLTISCSYLLLRNLKDAS
jgi:hypothetical protein